MTPKRSNSEKQTDRQLAKMRREFGPIVCELLFDPEVTEIMLNDDGRLWVERLGYPMEPVGTLAPVQAESAIKSVAAFWDDYATEESPIVEGRMPLDGVSRFEGLIPPVVSSPVFCIRRHTSRIVTFEDYISSGIMSGWDRDILCQRIENLDNIMVAGGTGSGKTTLLNTLTNHAALVHPTRRRVVIEDTPELKRVADNCVMLRVTRDTSGLALLKATMRLYPGSIDYGEVRDGAAHTLLKAWTTDHPGGFGTVHAKKGEIGGLLRLEQLVLEVVPTPMQTLIAEAVQTFVNIQRTPKGRTISGIIAVDGLEAGQYKVRNLHKTDKGNTND